MRSLDKIVELVNQAENAVKAVSRQRDRYAGIDATELSKRERLVSEARRSVRKMKETMTSTATRQKIDNQKRQKLYGSSPQAQGRELKLTSMRDSDYYEHQRQEQKDLYRQQDDTLDAMGNNVQTLNTYANAIGRELEDQARLLDEFGNEVDVAQTRMDKVLGGMQKLLKTKSTSLHTG